MPEKKQNKAPIPEKKQNKAPMPESLARKFPGKTKMQIRNMRVQACRMDPGDVLELPKLSDEEFDWLYY